MTGREQVDAPQDAIDEPLAVPLRTVRIITDTTATGPGTVIDADGRVRRIYDIDEDAVVLIRPDGYIATRTAIRAHSSDSIGCDG